MFLENEVGATPTQPEDGGNLVATPATPEQVDAQPTVPTASPTTPAKTPAGRQFSEQQVNELMKRRLERSHQRFFNRYGVKDLSELDSLIGKAQAYDAMRERYNNYKTENEALNEKNIFISNNINPERYEDVRAFFKGTNTLFNEGALIEALKTHPEWVKAIQGGTIKVLGSEGHIAPKENEAERAAKLLGVNLQ